MPRRRPVVLPALALAGLLLSGCAGAPGGSAAAASVAPATQQIGPVSDGEATAYPVTLDNCGLEVTLERAPQGVVTLNQGMTEVALALGLADRMSGTAYLDDEVAERYADDYARVAVLSEEYPTVEQFLAAGPDLALASYASAFGDTGVGDRAELHERGAATYVSPLACPGGPAGAPTFEAAWQELREVGLLTGTTARADAEVDAQREVLAQVEEEAAGRGLELLWYDSGKDTPFVGAGAAGPSCSSTRSAPRTSSPTSTAAGPTAPGRRCWRPNPTSSSSPTPPGRPRRPNGPTSRATRC
uniref:ABC transporter substrate-binding protein n=1 Tax=Ornithinimicrobium sp. CNJ-824 TaxID=1904966 RepID=UPI00192CEDF9